MHARTHIYVQVIWLRLTNVYSALPRFINQPLEYAPPALDPGPWTPYFWPRIIPCFIRPAIGARHVRHRRLYVHTRVHACIGHAYIYRYTTSATDVAILTLALILLLQRLCGPADGDFGAVQGPGPWHDVRPAATRVVPASRRDEMARPMLADGR